MTRNKQVSALVIAAVLTATVGSSAFAQQRSDREDRRAQMFAQLDRNADGVVTAEEFANPPSRFEIADADGDGVVTAEELAAMNQQRTEQRIARMIERLDADKDGVLSQEEFTARRDMSRMFDRLDANSDGMISAEEFAELRLKGHGGKSRNSGHRAGHGNR